MDLCATCNSAAEHTSIAGGRVLEYLKSAHCISALDSIDAFCWAASTLSEIFLIRSRLMAHYQT